MNSNPCSIIKILHTGDHLTSQCKLHHLKIGVLYLQYHDYALRPEVSSPKRGKPFLKTLKKAMPFQKRESLSCTLRNMLINQKSDTELGQKKWRVSHSFVPFPLFSHCTVPCSTSCGCKKCSQPSPMILNLNVLKYKSQLCNTTSSW